MTTRVAHVITRMIVGGAQENTLFSVLGLAALPGYRVALVTGAETGSEGNLLDGREGDADVTYVPDLVRALAPASDARALAALTSLFRETRPDVVHTHSSKAGVLGRIAARRAKVPVVVHTLHSLVFHAYQPAPVRFAYRTTKRLLVPLTDHYVSVSDNIGKRAVEAGIGTAERHSTIRSGFPTKDFVAALVPRQEARARLGLPADRTVVGVVGRLFELKGQDDLLEVARRVVPRHPDVLFAFVGSGPLREELERRAAEWGIDGHVTFLGRLPPDDMPVAYSAFDVLAHASLREGLARVLPQAVLAGLPVVCYDLDGASEVVHDGANGALVPARNFAAFARRLGEVVGDADLRARVGGVGREVILEEFSVDEMVGRLDALYQRLLEAAGR